MVSAVLLLVLITYFQSATLQPQIEASIPSRQTISTTSSPLSTQTTTDEPLKQKVLLDVPFVAQAPTGKWSDTRQQEGCEEAASYMAYLWVKGLEPSTDLTIQESALIEISDWEEKTYGSYHDTSTNDTVERILKGYFSLDSVSVDRNVTIESIKQKLSAGHLVLVPADGRALHNPYFTNGGPDRHFLAIIGYDNTRGEFITNDNGTRHGRGYRYKEDVMLSAIRDYPTGNNNPILKNEKVMIVVSK